MNYEFPKIYDIGDVLWAIKDSPEFIVVEKDGYTVVNYVIAGHETFPSVNYDESVDKIVAAKTRRECRGLVFDSLTGNLINRRYHKFFNVNERDETQLNEIDWNRPHVILEKLDGSMVSPCYVNGHIRWMTKMGITDTSMEAESFVASRPDYAELAAHYLKNGFTPVFEWCSNKNRIVLEYPEDRLVLTAMRETVSGNYLLQDALENIGRRYGIEVVKAYDVNDSKHPSYVVDMVRQAEDIEGIVVRFDDGHMVKIKADWYVRIHKVKSLLGQERDVVKLILNNELDDLLPVLPKEDVEKIEKFQVKLEDRLYADACILDRTIRYTQAAMDRKTFALEGASKINPLHRGMIFSFWDKECDEHLTYQAIVAMILKHCGNNASYAKVKEAFLKGIDYV
jgi:T4 RnlA family RNA ligase